MNDRQDLPPTRNQNFQKLLVLHGDLFDKSAYDTIKKELGPGNVIVIDLLELIVEQDIHSLPTLAEETLVIIRNNSLEGSMILGTGVGNRVLFHLSTNHPDLAGYQLFTGQVIGTPSDLLSIANSQLLQAIDGKSPEFIVDQLMSDLFRVSKSLVRENSVAIRHIQAYLRSQEFFEEYGIETLSRNKVPNCIFLADGDLEGINDNMRNFGNIIGTNKGVYLMPNTSNPEELICNDTFARKIQELSAFTPSEMRKTLIQRMVVTTSTKQINAY